MGLHIKKYYYPYGVLHQLRAWAHEVVACAGFPYWCYALHEDLRCQKCLICLLDDEKAPEIKFKEFIIHSDCEYGYTTSKEKMKQEEEWGDLKKLKEEILYLKKCADQPDRYPFLTDWHRQAFNDFADDVLSAKRGLRFH